MASYIITEIFVKNKKPFEDGNMIKECLVVAGDSLFNELKMKLKCEMQLRRYSYHGGSSVEE